MKKPIYKNQEDMFLKREANSLREAERFYCKYLEYKEYKDQPKMDKYLKLYEKHKADAKQHRESAEEHKGKTW